MKWLQRRTLVFRIYISFLVIILLFSVFNLLTVHLFSRSVQQEMVQYNEMMLQNTADRYRTHFERIRTLLFDMYSKEEVVAFNHQAMRKETNELDFTEAKDIIKDIRTQVSNPMFYLNNFIYHFEKGGIILEKEGSLSSNMMFSNFYNSSEYPLSYWNDHIAWQGTFKMHPESAYEIKGTNDSQSRKLIPVTFHMPPSRYQVIALLDAEQMKEAYYDSGEDREFMILDREGTVLYRTSDKISAGMLSEKEPGQGYAVSGGYHLFEKRDDESGMTYVSAVSSSSIAAKVRSTNWNLFLILIVSSVLGVIVSLYFTRGIHRPVKQFAASILHRDPDKFVSKVAEFDLIHQNIRELMDEKETVQKELKNKQSLLTSFGYINKLKAIVSDINDWKDIAEIDEPFFVILFQLHFKPVPEEHAHMKTSRMAYYIHEYINVVMSESFPASHTLQIENNQIICLIRGDVVPADFDQTMAQLKEGLDRDSEYILVTIGISSVYGRSADFNEAYMEVMELIQHERPMDECQIIRGPLPAAPAVVMTVQQEQELYANLQAGNDAFCTSFMERVLVQFDRKGASLRQLRKFAEGVQARVIKILEPYRSTETGQAEIEMQRILECTTLEQFKLYFAELFHMAAATIHSKKEAKDPIITFVMEQLENGDIDSVTLEQLAERLNLSAAYLSVYIKENTGANFSEHMNNVRIRKAKDLLACSDMTIQDISSRLGYSNVTSFNRMFKKVTGLPPGEFRKREFIERQTRA